MLDALGEIQLELRRLRLDGWLLVDRGRSNPVAAEVLELDEARPTRPLAYLVHAEDMPHLLVHASDARRLADLPGDRTVYTSRATYVDALAKLLPAKTRIAVEHSPMATLPSASWIDSGTFELLGSFGAQLVSSVPLVSRFVSPWSERDVATHCEAAARAERAFDAAWRRLASDLDGADETRLVALLSEELERVALRVDEAPIVAAGPHSCDPEHRAEPRAIGLVPGTPLVVGLRVRCASPLRSAWASRFWTAFVGGDEPPERMRALFDAACVAADRAVAVLRDALEREQSLLGCDVHAAVRRELSSRGHDSLALHRLGHSLGIRACQGLGANLDDVETRDTRAITAGAALAITPGLYDRDMGVRVATNVIVDESSTLHVTAARQPAIVVLP
ncbi:MAG: M24 family metallopeptidase [Deltaproteobacteria bacterium]|nr:M24 family metallopeptidase [Deltaproteobacteria bacterium]